MAREKDMSSRERIFPVLSMIVGLSLVGIIAAWVAVPSYSVWGEIFHYYNGDGLRYAVEPPTFEVKVEVPYSLVARTRGILSILLGVLVVAATFLPSTSSGSEFFIDFPKKIVMVFFLLYGGGTVISLIGLILVPGTDLTWQGLPFLLEVAIFRSIFSSTMTGLLICLTQFLVKIEGSRKTGNQRIKLYKEIGRRQIHEKDES